MLLKTEAVVHPNMAGTVRCKNRRNKAVRGVIIIIYKEKQTNTYSISLYIYILYVLCLRTYKANNIN